MEQNTEHNQRSTTETVKDVTESGKQIFAAGERIMNDLNELEERVDRATDWRVQYDNHPALILGAAFVGGLLLSTFVTPRPRY
jgi:chromosomal replication initiation ATPase DnaA